MVKSTSAGLAAAALIVFLSFLTKALAQSPFPMEGGRNDAACQATAEFRYCQASVAVGCRGYHFVFACRLLQLSYQNASLFQAIMNAQRACLLDRNPQACRYLQRFRGVYFS